MKTETIYVKNFIQGYLAFNKVQDLSDKQILVEKDGDFLIVHPNEVVSKEQYDKYLKEERLRLKKELSSWIIEGRISVGLVQELIGEIINETK